MPSLTICSPPIFRYTLRAAAVDGGTCLAYRMSIDIWVFRPVRRIPRRSKTQYPVSDLQAQEEHHEPPGRTCVTQVGRRRSTTTPAENLNLLQRALAATACVRPASASMSKRPFTPAGSDVVGVLFTPTWSKSFVLAEAQRSRACIVLVAKHEIINIFQKSLGYDHVSFHNRSLFEASCS
jgi:hypothetical protein